MNVLLVALAAAAVTQVGGVHGPEDFEVLPGGQVLLVSEFGGLQSAPARIALFDRATRRVTTLYPGQAAGPPAPKWGEPACTKEPGAGFSPHGIHLSRRADGALQLLAVNHGGRESIEFFEVTGGGANVKLAWRGCAQPDPDSFLNDVAALPGGGLVATMMYRRSDAEGLARAFRGENTGYVLRWSRAAGWSRIPGTDGPMPNGVQSTPDGRHLYVAMWGASRVVKLELASGRVVGAVNTPHPDNLSWAPDGRLLATGPESMPSYTECRTGREPGCFAPSHVDAIDTKSLQATTIFRFERREMLPASVAVQVDRTLYVGSYDGDHLLEVSLDAAPAARGGKR